MEPFERRTAPFGPTWLVARDLESRGVLAAFTERTGGRSAAPFDSLNLGFTEGDDPADVRENRGAVCAALGIPSFSVGQQVHGRAMATIGPDSSAAGFAGPASAIPGCDALETTDGDVALAVLTADCVPIALADDRRVVTVHAGWRGLADGVLAVAVERFAEPGRVAAAIGPAIGPCHYEVGRDVLEAARWEEHRIVRRGSTRYLDLPGIAEDRLRAGGVRDVAAGSPCTACETDRFFSYRRDGRTGRQALVAMRR